MYLLVAKRYWQVTAIIRKILIEYSKVFFFLSQAKPVLLMLILQSLQGQFSVFHFNFILKSI